MAITDYASLQAEIVTFSWRDGDTDFANSVTTFIQGCEQALNYGAGSIDALRVGDMETAAPLTITNSQASLPADYLQWRSIKGVGSHNVELEVRDPSWINAQYPITTGRCLPFVSISGTTLTSYNSSITSISLDYYAKIPALSDANPANWLLTKAPMVYLYGSLLQAAPFMMDDARMQTFGTMFQQAVAGLVNSDLGSRYARVVSRVRGATP